MIDLFSLIIIGITLAMIIFISYTFIMKRRFPVTAIIFQDRAGKGVLVSFDKAGRVSNKKTGKSFYKLKKLKKYLPAVNYNDITPSTKGPLLYLHSMDPDDYVTMTIKATDESGEKGKELVAERDREKARRMAYTTVLNELYMKYMYKTTWEKFMPIILLIVFAFSIAVIMIAASQGLTDNIAALSGQIARLSGLTESLATIEAPPY